MDRVGHFSNCVERPGARFASKPLPGQLSAPAGGRTGMQKTGPISHRHLEGPEGRHGAALRPSHSDLTDSAAGNKVWEWLCSAALCRMSSSPSQEIRRIRVQTTLALLVVVALWLCICGFVALAIYLDWKL